MRKKEKQKEEKNNADKWEYGMRGLHGRKHSILTDAIG